MLKNIPSLLLVLEAIALETGAFDIQVSIGVESSSGACWWNRPGDFSAAPHPEAKATLALGQAEAEALVREGRLPEGPCVLKARGDLSILRQFLARLSPLELRGAR